MNFLKISFLSLFVFFSFSLNLYSQQSEIHGLELCDELSQYIEKLEMDVKKQEIITSPENNFPYNIVVNFPANAEDSNNLIICMKMENAWTHKNLVLDILSDLKYRNFNSTVAFIYGNIMLPRRMAISGEQAFINSLDPGDNHTAFIIDLDKNENSIQTGSMNSKSPSWLVNSTFDAYIKEKLSEDLPVYYLSQMSKMDLTRNTIFSSFSRNSIPAISAGFNTQTTTDLVIYKVISNFFDSYKDDCNKPADYHSLMFRFGSHKIYFSEYTIVKIWIAIALLSLIFIYILAFINKSLGNTAWEEIRKNWYSIPAIYILTIAGFFLAKGIYYLYTKNGSQGTTAFGLPVFQLSIATFFVFSFFLAEIKFHKKSYGERSVDFLIVMTTFINQFLFCLSDISLFPLFMLLCIFSILSLILRRNWFHILLFVIMIAAYMPYVFQLYSSTQASSLRFFLQRGNSLSFALAFIVLPIYLMWFRILTAIRKYVSKLYIFTIINYSTYLVLIITAICLNAFLFSDSVQNQNNFKIIEHSKDQNDLISATWKDEKVFDDTLRTITIKLAKPCVYSSVNIRSTEGGPVLYSQYDYTQNNNTAFFQIPSYPPQKMKFSYGTNIIDSTIEIEAIVSGNNPDEYESYRLTLITGE